MGLQRRTAPAIWVEERGSGPATLLCLHGLGGNGHVWDRFVERIAPHWKGRILVPDLRGHGRSEAGAAYPFGLQAADLGEVVGVSRPLVVVGHSLGGIVGLLLASGCYGPEPDLVFALGVMPVWEQRHHAQAAELAARPTEWFEDERSAVERFLWLSGLRGFVPPESRAAQSGVVAENGRYRLRQDRGTYSTGAPNLPGFLAAARCPVLLIYGRHDELVDQELVKRFVPERETWEGGHNHHLERPDRLADLMLERCAALLG